MRCCCGRCPIPNADRMVRGARDAARRRGSRRRSCRRASTCTGRATAACSSDAAIVDYPGLAVGDRQRGGPPRRDAGVGGVLSALRRHADRRTRLHAATPSSRATATSCSSATQGLAGAVRRRRRRRRPARSASKAGRPTVIGILPPAFAFMGAPDPDRADDADAGAARGHRPLRSTSTRVSRPA